MHEGTKIALEKQCVGKEGNRELFDYTHSKKEFSKLLKDKKADKGEEEV